MLGFPVAPVQHTISLGDGYTLWPKVDLHRHLEGCVRLDTAWMWAQRSKSLADFDFPTLRSAIQFDGIAGFQRFLSKFATLRELYRDPRAIGQVAREAVADAAADSIRYVELRFSPDHFSQHSGLGNYEAALTVIEAANDEAHRHGILVRYLITIGRGYSQYTADSLVDIALELRSIGVVGLDLAGDEIKHRGIPFRKLLLLAAADGLRLSIHAGEAGPASAIWAAIERLPVQRIGHGTHAAQDPKLLKALSERFIPVEICLTSNLQTGVLPYVAAHPLRQLLDAGVPVALCTDDPAISDITLSEEYALAEQRLGLSQRELADMVIASADYAFLSPTARADLRSRLTHDLDALMLASARP